MCRPSGERTERPTPPGRSGRRARGGRGCRRPGFIFTWSVVPPNGSAAIVPGFICQRRLNTCVGHGPAPSRSAPAQVVGRPLDAVGDPRGEERAVRRVRLALEDRAAVGALVRVRGRDQDVRRAGCPSPRRRSALAASTTSPGTMQLSTTTKASFVVPSSSTRQRACSSSWTCVARRSVMPPLIDDAERRRDVARRGPGAKQLGLHLGLGGESGEEQGRRDKPSETVHEVLPGARGTNK